MVLYDDRLPSYDIYPYAFIGDIENPEVQAALAESVGRPLNAPGGGGAPLDFAPPPSIAPAAMQAMGSLLGQALASSFMDQPGASAAAPVAKSLPSMMGGAEALGAPRGSRDPFARLIGDVGLGEAVAQEGLVPQIGQNRGILGPTQTLPALWGLGRPATGFGALQRSVPFFSTGIQPVMPNPAVVSPSAASSPGFFGGLLGLLGMGG